MPFYCQISFCCIGTGRGWAGLGDCSRQQGLDLEKGASKTLLDGWEDSAPYSGDVEAVLLWSLLWKRPLLHGRGSCTRSRIILA